MKRIISQAVVSVAYVISREGKCCHFELRKRQILLERIKNLEKEAKEESGRHTEKFKELNINHVEEVDSLVHAHNEKIRSLEDKHNQDIIHYQTNIDK